MDHDRLPDQARSYMLVPGMSRRAARIVVGLGLVLSVVVIVAVSPGAG